MLPTDRLAYSPITERAPLQLPNGARMAVWVIVNVEEWDATQPMPRTVLTPPAGGSPMPDVPNWAWHEYGNRVGFWRFIKVFDEFKIPGVIAINGGVPIKAGNEVIGGVGLSGSPGKDEECVNAGLEKVKQYLDRKSVV